MALTKRYATKLYKVRHASKPTAIIYDPDSKCWLKVDLSKQQVYASKKEALAE